MTKIDKSVLTFGITIFLKFMLFDILWCIPTTFASSSVSAGEQRDLVLFRRVYKLRDRFYTARDNDCRRFPH